MKSNNAAIAAMQQLLQERCLAEPAFAIKMANPSKSMEGAVNYLCNEIKKSGLCVVEESMVLGILSHYFDEENVDEGAPVNCNIVVSKPELTEEDKTELREEAKKQFQEEELKRLRRESIPKAVTSTTTSHKAKETPKDNQPNLFNF